MCYWYKLNNHFNRCQLYQSSDVCILASCSSDHKPIALHFAEFEQPRVFFKRNFKVEASWMHDEEYNAIVRTAWEEAGNETIDASSVAHKLARCQTRLSSWSSRKFRRVDKELEKKTKTLEVLQRNENEGNWEEIRRLKGEIESILEHEDIKWKQRAKQNWYANGDRNTPFFHAWANHRRRINQI
jgi:hypothetical protein